MAESAKLPTFDTMMWPTLVALEEMGGSASNQELLAKVTQLMGLAEEIQTIPHGEGPTTEVGYRLAWARTYLGKAGAIENSSRSVWSITPKGRELTEQQVAKIPSEVRAGYSRTAQPDTDKPLDINPSEGLDGEVGDEDWKAQLLSVLQSMAPDSFERLAQRILRESGFVKVEVKGRSGDGGIDGVGVLRLNLLSFQVFFQCKRYKDTVGPGDIRDFRGAMVGRTDKGLFVTTGRFTPDAKREATRDGAPPLELIDGEQLCDILKSLKLGVSIEMVEQVTVHPEVFKGI